jgi:hypothetical protein
VAGIGFLIAMFGVASCLLGGLYFLFRDDHPSDEAKKRRKRPPGIGLEIASIVIRAQDLAGLWVDQMHLRARKARHLDVREVIVFAVISPPSLDVVAVLGQR